MGKQSQTDPNLMIITHASANAVRRPENTTHQVEDETVAFDLAPPYKP